nr:CDP-glycerol glycerophosphotransferase family protein [Auraticoccus cholistanensis]
MERPVRAELARHNAGAQGPHPCAVWFSQPVEHLYQVEQWLGPLERLSEQHPVLLLVNRPGSARALAALTRLPVHLARRTAEVDALLARHDVRLVFYVNNAQANFTMLRTNGQRHVHLSHGESNKSSMVSHQLRAYDFCFVAGPASRQRVLDAVWGVDADRLVEVGRPQLDHVPVVAPPVRGRRTVLYAPTWEGDSAAMAYGSVASHGVALVRSLLADPGLRVVVRPHPLTGSRSPDHARALATLRSLVEHADPAAGHRVDTAVSARQALGEAEVAISDVSAMAMDCLGLGRRVAVTRPVHPGAWIDPQGITSVLPTLDAADAGQASTLARRLLAEPPPPAEAALVARLFGDISAGAQTRRFLEAVERVLATVPAS